ncbi:hypothetical protein SCHPADRAFT_999939 [Schizopora paradoxa]|uniref:Cap binding protein 80-PB n=1 Tax=Schizopora paradoxa TaxID=27342 RepID=A0A0H2RDM1_9AGAM|nr:hypothetical protein SCHPADRAFT_999939 [Schizopora paradoxa]
MSYRYNGGGRRRNYRDDHDDRFHEPFETPEERLKKNIIKFGDVDTEVEAPRLSKHLREIESPSIVTIADGIRIGFTEQPYKIPHYVALLRSISQDADGSTENSLGKQVLDDIWKGFQAFLDKLAWREVRLSIHFFAHLASAGLISIHSMLSLLQSFTAVLEEFGVSHNRAKNAALCAAEGLLIAGPSLKAHSPAEVTALVSAIETHVEASSANNFLVCPIVHLYERSGAVEGADEVLDIALALAKSLEKMEFSEASKAIVQPYEKDDGITFTPFFDLPSVLVPPEVIELDHLTNGEASTSPQKNDDWAEYKLHLFDSGVTAESTTILGYTTNALISDIIDIFEVNRKECARILLELPRWCPPGTFKPRANSPDTVVDGPCWQLESTLMENILSKLFTLPKPNHKAVYYVALITELCKLSPSTTGPSVGKSIRRLYGLLGDGLDVEIAQRFVTWFATHMSNFGFQWVWKEWIPDLQLVSHHPKRNFIRRSIEIEIRLAYYDRIIKTLPEPYLGSEAETVPDQAPAPEYEYDEPSKPHHDTAQSLLGLLKGRTKADEVITHIETLKNDLAESEINANVDTLIRSMAIQSLLHIGSRSFSHFLNAIERYLPVLRHLAPTSDAKLDILLAAADFWRRQRQMVLIVFDKLMQYQIVDPSDVIAWAFSKGSNASTSPCRIDAFRWGLIESALDKANGRVAIARRKVVALRKEEDESRARATASGNMEVDADVAAETEEAPVVDSPALTNAVKAQTTLIKEQKAVLSNTLGKFIDKLKDTSSILSEKAWQNRANWEDAEWETWETWAFYRNFCRLYAPYLRTYAETLGSVSISKIAGSSDEASLLLKKIWNASTGQEA